MNMHVPALPQVRKSKKQNQFIKKGANTICEGPLSLISLYKLYN